MSGNFQLSMASNSWFSFDTPKSTAFCFNCAINQGTRDGCSIQHAAQVAEASQGIDGPSLECASPCLIAHSTPSTCRALMCAHQSVTPAGPSGSLTELLGLEEEVFWSKSLATPSPPRNHVLENVKATEKRFLNATASSASMTDVSLMLKSLLDNDVLTELYRSKATEDSAEGEDINPRRLSLGESPTRRQLVAMFDLDHSRLVEDVFRFTSQHDQLEVPCYSTSKEKGDVHTTEKGAASRNDSADMFENFIASSQELFQDTLEQESPQQPLEGTPLGPQQPLEGTPLGPQQPLEGTPLRPQQPLEGTPLGPQQPLEGTSLGPQQPLEGTPPFKLPAPILCPELSENTETEHEKFPQPSSSVALTTLSSEMTLLPGSNSLENDHKGAKFHSNVLNNICNAGTSTSFSPPKKKSKSVQSMVIKFAYPKFNNSVSSKNNHLLKRTPQMKETLKRASFASAKARNVILSTQHPSTPHLNKRDVVRRLPANMRFRRRPRKPHAACETPSRMDLTHSKSLPTLGHRRFQIQRLDHQVEAGYHPSNKDGIGPVGLNTEDGIGPVGLNTEGRTGPVELNTEDGTGPVELNTEDGTGPVDLNTEGRTGPVKLNTEDGTGPVELNTEGRTGPVELNTEDGTGPVELNTEDGTGPVELNTEGRTGPVELNTEDGTGPVELNTEDGTGPVELNTEATSLSLHEHQGTPGISKENHTCVSVNSDLHVSNQDNRTGDSAAMSTRTSSNRKRKKSVHCRFSKSKKRKKEVKKDLDASHRPNNQMTTSNIPTSVQETTTASILEREFPLLNQETKDSEGKVHERALLTDKVITRRSLPSCRGKTKFRAPRLANEVSQREEAAARRRLLRGFGIQTSPKDISKEVLSSFNSIGDLEPKKTTVSLSGSATDFSFTKSRGPVGFSTASGRPLAASTEVIKKAKSLFEKIESEGTSTKTVADGPVGFSTASGKRITISEDTLRKAEQLLREDLEDSKEEPGSVKPTNCHGFSTASGCPLAVSTEVIKKAKSLFEKIESEGTSTKTVADGPVGFSTASGKRITISEDTLRKAEQLLREDLEDSKEEPGSVKPTNCHGFSTASGRPLAVSTEAIKKAKSLFEKIESEGTSTKPVSDGPVGFSTASGKGIRVSEAALLKARYVIEDQSGNEADVDCKSKVDMATDGAPFCGFSTANGKCLSVSTAAMRKAEAIMSEEGQEEIALETVHDFPCNNNPTGVDPPTVIKEATPTLIREAPPTLIREAPPSIIGEAPPEVIGEAPPKVIGEAPPKVIGEALLLATEDIHVAVVAETNKDAGPLGVPSLRYGHTDCETEDYVAGDIDFDHFAAFTQLRSPQQPEPSNQNPPHNGNNSSETITYASSSTLSINEESDMHSVELSFLNTQMVREVLTDSPSGDSPDLKDGETEAQVTSEGDDFGEKMGEQTSRETSLANPEQFEEDETQILQSPPFQLSACDNPVMDTPKSTQKDNVPTTVRTVSGIRASEMAVKNAKNHFDSLDSTSPVNIFCEGSVRPFSGLQTASGKAVAISMEALEKVRLMREDRGPMPSSSLQTTPTQPLPQDCCGWMEYGQPPPQCTNKAGGMKERYLGLQTASGKAVQVSEEALQHVRAVKDFHSCSEKTGQQGHTNISDDGSVPAHQGSTNISDDGSVPAHQGSTNISDDGSVPAHQGSTNISDDGSVPAHQGSTNISGDGSAPTHQDGTNISNDGSAPVHQITSYGGLQTASGKKVAISSEALKQAQFLLSTSDTKKSTFPLLQTAGGKEVHISEEALCKARLALDDTPTSHVPQESHCQEAASAKGASDLQTTSLKQAYVSTETFQDVRDSRGQCRTQPGDPPVSSFPGLTTAGGGAVNISESALEHVRGASVQRSDRKDLLAQPRQSQHTSSSVNQKYSWKHQPQDSTSPLKSHDHPAAADQIVQQTPVSTEKYAPKFLPQKNANTSKQAGPYETPKRSKFKPPFHSTPEGSLSDRRRLGQYGGVMSPKCSPDEGIARAKALSSVTQKKKKFVYTVPFKGSSLGLRRPAHGKPVRSLEEEKVTSFIATTKQKSSKPEAKVVTPLPRGGMGQSVTPLPRGGMGQSVTPLPRGGMGQLVTPLPRGGIGRPMTHSTPSCYMNSHSSISHDKQRLSSTGMTTVSAAKPLFSDNYRVGKGGYPLVGISPAVPHQVSCRTNENKIGTVAPERLFVEETNTSMPGHAEISGSVDMTDSQLHLFMNLTQLEDSNISLINRKEESKQEIDKLKEGKVDQPKTEQIASSPNSKMNKVSSEISTSVGVPSSKMAAVSDFPPPPTHSCGKSEDTVPLFSLSVQGSLLDDSGISTMPTSASTTMNEAITSHQSNPVSHQSNPVSHQSNPVSHQSNPVSHQSNPVSHQSNPVSHQSNPVSHQSNPVSHQSNPVSHQSNPVSHQSNPVSHQSNPVSYKSNPVSHQNNPVLYQSNPVSHQSNPVSHQSNPVSHQSNPVSHQSNPVSHQSNPVSHQSNPVSHQSNPVSHQSNPVSHQSNPVSHQSNPVSHQSNPVSHQSNPVSHQSNPVSHQNNPIEATENQVIRRSQRIQKRLAVEYSSEPRVKRQKSNTMELHNNTMFDLRSAAADASAGKIRITPGVLYSSRQTDRTKLVPLKSLLPGSQSRPPKYTVQELRRFGVQSSVLAVTVDSAEKFTFDGSSYFSKAVLEGQGVRVGDGGTLHLRPDGSAGAAELERAFYTTPGVDPRLISSEWFRNHYKWLVWKLASLEVSFPHDLSGRMLSPHWLLLQMKYRYDREIDRSQRSALRKIYEHDDTPAKTMVLCVSKVFAHEDQRSKEPCGEEEEKTGRLLTVELTDGWYSIGGVFDDVLKYYLRQNTISVGTKLYITGAELVGLENPSPPLEAPSGVYLKMNANSTRRARWNTKLGFQRNTKPFHISLATVLPDGGKVGATALVIARVYPLLFMEKKPDGSKKFHTERLEEIMERDHRCLRQKIIDKICEKERKSFEEDLAKEDVERLSHARKRRRLTQRQIKNLEDGEEIYEALQQSTDPQSFQECLSTTQRIMLMSYKENVEGKRKQDLQKRIQLAIQEAEDGQLPPKRDVVPLLRARVVQGDPSHSSIRTATFCIWRPTEHVKQLIRESASLKVYHLQASEGRSKSVSLQLSATKLTCYERIDLDETKKELFIPRKVSPLSTLNFTQHAYGEVDIVGLVVHVVSSTVPTARGESLLDSVYLADEEQSMLQIKIWDGLKALGCDDLVRPGTVVSVTNLQHVVHQGSLQAGDTAVFSQNPKEGYLQQAIRDLRKRLPKNLKEYQDSLMDILNF